jgi:hypothetical protein
MAGSFVGTMAVRSNGNCFFKRQQHATHGHDEYDQTGTHAGNEVCPK